MPKPPANTPWSPQRSHRHPAVQSCHPAASLSSRIAAEESASTCPDYTTQLGPDTLLKVGHHGSRTSTTPEFLALVAPQDAVISVGLHNTFGHPSPEVIQRLHDAQALVFRTDQFGITTFLLSRDGQISALTPASYP